ncbi:GntR family transcriptional regulator [Alteribacillus sp. YIM 98480]|uniref:GntR family transcriptional regulator n=1 Tax=Alteribacillus sp. YIM 98480 TaxID=2606599 RepID=UPI00131E6998|nr:GntR family transcriptional regulator [Alteribacillus sp. YIM 98480]
MLQRKSSKSMYLQISEFIKKQILEGIYEEGSKIPTEIELMERFNVSRTTIRLAMKEVVKEGLLETKPGKGTFVSKGKMYHHLQGFKGLYETFLEAGMTPETKLIDFETVVSNYDIQLSLGLEVDTKILRIMRLYLIDNEPIALAEISVHPKLADLISEEDAAKYPVYKTLSTRSGHRIKQAHFEIFAKDSSDYVAEALNIEQGSATLGAERVLFSEKNEPVEHTYLWFKPDAYRFTLDLEGENGLKLVDASKFQK